MLLQLIRRQFTQERTWAFQIISVTLRALFSAVWMQWAVDDDNAIEAAIIRRAIDAIWQPAGSFGEHFLPLRFVSIIVNLFLRTRQ